MPKYMGSAILDNGLDYARARAAAGDAIKVHVLKAYSSGDSYATVIGNSVGSAALAAGDLALANDSTTGRKVTVASKSITAASANSGASPDLHQAVVNETTSAVYLVTDETSNQVITAGNPITTTSWSASLPFANT